MTRHAAVYCRISVDRSGRHEGVDAQERWGRDYALSAWPGVPVVVYADNDMSAADGGHRPAYERLRQAIRDGHVARLWAVEQSRLERREVGWFELAAELDAAGIGELHTNRDGIVRVHDDVAGIKAVLNAGEVRKLKRRVNERLDEIAGRGEPSGTRPYGYRHARTDGGTRTYEVIPDQAAILRETAERVLSGWSLTNIARDLTERGITGGHGGKLSSTAVRHWVTNPTVAGKRVHRGRIVGEGNWPPILDAQTWQACRHKLSAPRVVQRIDGGTYPVGKAHNGWNARTARRYLLTGTLCCAICGAPLAGGMKQLRGGRTAPYYHCHPNRGGRACTGTMAEPLERHVLAELMRQLATPAFVKALTVDDQAQRRQDLTDRLDDVERQREELAEMWGTPGELTSAEWRTARRALAEQEQALRAELAAIPPPLSGIDPKALTDPRVWEAMTLDERREMLTLFVARVVLDRAKPPYSRFDTTRVRIEWRER